MILRMIAVALSTITIFGMALSAVAQGSSSSSESSSYQRGYGSTQANVFAPKYRQRLQNWTEQMVTGRERGWLTDTEIERFTAEHARLAALNLSMESQNYPKAETDSMEKQFSAFNVLLTQAMSKPVTTAAPSATTPKGSGEGAPSTVPATPPAAIKEPPTTTTKTTAKSKISKATAQKTVCPPAKKPAKKS